MGNLTLEDVNNMYLDVLKEIGNIGAGSFKIRNGCRSGG